MAQKQDDPMLMIWAHNALATTLYFLGDFESARQHAMHGVRIWRSGRGQSDPTHAEDVDTPVVGCLCHEAFFRLASRRGRLLPSETERSDFTSKGAEGYARISHGAILGSGSGHL